MSSITRAVTSRLSELTSGRQRLTTEKNRVAEAPPPPAPSNFNFIIPPEIIWEEYQASKQEPLKVEVEPEPKVEVVEKKTSPSIFSQKMSAVVRKLSPFSDDSSSSKEKDAAGSSAVSEEGKKKSGGRFKETKQRLKKFRRSKDRQQLIESSDDEA